MSRRQPVPGRDHAATLAAAALVATCLAALLAGIAVTLAPAEIARAWPTPGPAAMDGRTALAWAMAAWALAALLLTVAASRIRAGGHERPFAELILLFPLAFAHLWFLAHPGTAAARVWIPGGILAAAAVFLLLRGPRRLPGISPLSRRTLLAGDTVMILGPALLGLAAGNGIEKDAVGISLLLYPFYAAVQLAVFMVLPAPRLQALGLGPRAVAATCALVFGFFHWPHPVVMLATGLGMFIWCRAWLGGRSFLQIALVVGMAATTFSQFLPDGWTGHVRIGPAAARTAAVDDLAFAPGRGRVPTRDWLAATYPPAVGRPATTAELDRWEQALAPLRRADTAWMFFTSDEFQRRATAADREFPPSQRTHWSHAEAAWQRRVLALATDDYRQRHGNSWPAFVAALYRDILGREPAAAEVAAWTEDLAVGQRLGLAQWLLHERADLADAPFDTATVTRLARPY